MHLLIDGQALQTPSSRQRGIGRYSSNLLRALAAVRPSWRIELVQNSTLTPIAADDRNGLPFLSFQPPLPLHLNHCELNERYYADWLTAQGADGVLVLSFCEGWEAVVPSFCGPRPRLFGIAYDFIPLLYPQHYLTELGTLPWYAHRFRQLLQCDTLLAISAATARDARALGGRAAPRVVNIGGAVDPLFAPLSASELSLRAPQVRKRFGLQREFLLYVGALDYRKNLHGAIRAFAALPSECRACLDLAVVCRMTPEERASIEAMAQQAGVASAVRAIDSASDEDLRALYQMCRIFFFPSLYEGLGLPVLEALHCGAPVATSDRSSLPEYAGPHSWMGDPASPQAMARLLQEALAEPREARRAEREAFAHTFTWQKTAERTCAVMERIVEKRGRPRRRRRRLAWVMPLTRNTSNMTAFAAELLPLLAERFEIELIAASATLEAAETLSRRHLLLTAREVPARHAVLPYDMFLYQLPPPPRHRDMLELLRRFPGLVVLHDFSAADLDGLVESKLLSPQDLGDWYVGESASAGQSTAGERAAAFTAWIDRAISRHEQSDGLWRDFAVQCLADCGDAAGAVLDSWASLRARARSRISV